MALPLRSSSNTAAASHWPLFRQDIKYGDKAARFSTPCSVPLHSCTSVRCTPLAIRDGVTHLEVSSAITGLSLNSDSSLCDLQL
ncbi:hypothetical protein CEXT_422601 [Caerostris extrusa]|uniref:Uncharacterized protein n=1 Tax=Caerostris extrusa TaxID=172846 RepID=A0AAV4MVY3_CAEEX|nr:hypothetical protein CEXT_422601 [Caerostris extrusa]